MEIEGVASMCSTRQDTWMILQLPAAYSRHRSRRGSPSRSVRRHCRIGRVVASRFFWIVELGETLAERSGGKGGPKQVEPRGLGMAKKQKHKSTAVGIDAKLMRRSFRKAALL